MTLIRGQAFDPEGAPVVGAAVYVVSAPAAMPDIAQLTDGDGRFALAAPLPGRYTLGVRSDDFGQAQSQVEVAGEEEVSVEMRFRRTEEALS